MQNVTDIVSAWPPIERFVFVQKSHGVASERIKQELERSPYFEFIDVAGNNLHQHMHHAKFTFIDANHHIEEWTFMLGDQTVHAHFDLQRKADASAAASK